MALQSTNNSQVPPDFATGIENRNFLSPIGFRFTIGKMKGVDFFCQAASIPALNMEAVNQHTRFNKVPQPGDELYYEDLKIRFLVDENMKNWYQCHDWMRGIATPYSSKEFHYDRKALKSQNPFNSLSDLTAFDNDWKSDCSLFILSSNYRPIAEFTFYDSFPTQLSTLNFDAGVQDIQYFTAEITMKYSHYDYFIYPAATATDASMEPTFRRSNQGASL